MNLNVLTCLLLFLSSITCEERFKRGTGQWVISQLKCYSNPKYVKDQLCTLKSVSRNEVLLSLGGTLLRPHHNVTIQVQHWQRMNSNRFMPGLFNVKGDLCQVMEAMVGNHDNLIKTVLMQINPYLMSQYKDVIHTCPYEGAVYVRNISMPRTYRSTLMVVFPTSGFKLDYKLLAENGDEGFVVSLVGSDK